MRVFYGKGFKGEERRVLEWLQANVNPATGVTYLPSGGVYNGAPD